MPIKKGILFSTIFAYGYASLHKNNSADMRKTMYNKGRNISQKYKPYAFWDNLVEPFIIRQFGFVFGMGHSFVKGMISDNDIRIDDQLDREINRVIMDKV